MSEKYTINDIKSIAPWEHVRMRPKMYFEQCFSENSLDSLPFEVLGQSLNEFFDENYSEVKLTVRKNSFTIKYNAGLSLSEKELENMSKAELIMTKIETFSDLKKDRAVDQVFCRLGIPTINFASTKTYLTTIWKNEKGSFEFENGMIKTKNIEPFESHDSWTEIYFEPNQSIFENLHFTSDGVKKKATEIELPGNVHLSVIENIK